MSHQPDGVLDPPDDPETITWNLERLGVGESKLYQVKIRAGANLPPGDTLTNLVTVRSDEVPRIEVQSIDNVVGGRLVLSLHTNTMPVVAGENTDVRACLINDGPGRAQDVEVLAYLHDDMEYVSSQPASSYDGVNHRIIYNVGDLPPQSGQCYDMDARVLLDFGHTRRSQPQHSLGGVGRREPDHRAAAQRASEPGLSSGCQPLLDSV